MQHYSLKLWFNKSAQQFCTYSRRNPVSYVSYSSQENSYA